MTTWVIAIYELDRAYGGPEEGGWYYDCGELERVVRVCGSMDAAYAACRRANDWLRRVQCGKREVSSVIYEGGRFGARVYRNHAPKVFPVARPHYE